MLTTPPLGIAHQFLAGRAPRAEESDRLTKLEAAVIALAERVEALEKELKPAEPSPSDAAAIARAVAAGRTAGTAAADPWSGAIDKLNATDRPRGLGVRQ